MESTSLAEREGRPARETLPPPAGFTPPFADGPFPHDLSQDGGNVSPTLGGKRSLDPPFAAARVRSSHFGDTPSVIRTSGPWWGAQTSLGEAFGRKRGAPAASKPLQGPSGGASGAPKPLQAPSGAAQGDPLNIREPHPGHLGPQGRNRLDVGQSGPGAGASRRPQGLPGASRGFQGFPGAS